MRNNLALKANEAPGALKEVDRAALTGADTDKDAVREGIARNRKVDPAETTDSPLDPETLKKMFLTGKLTQGQLAHELKKYNDVVADTIIKEGKHAKASIVDYKDVARANIANPGADLKPEETRFEHRAQTKDEARKQVRDSDDPEKKKELQKQEQKQKQIESQKTVTQAINYMDRQREQTNSHLLRDKHIQEEQQKEADVVDKELKPHEKTRTNRTNLARRLKTTLALRMKRLMNKLAGGAKGSTK